MAAMIMMMMVAFGKMTSKSLRESERSVPM